MSIAQIFIYSPPPPLSVEGYLISHPLSKDDAMPFIRKKDDPNVATFVNYGVASYVSWTKSMCKLEAFSP